MLGDAGRKREFLNRGAGNPLEEGMRHLVIAALLLCGSVDAGDVDAGLRAARALMESDDPAERDRGEALLAEVAEEAGARLKELLEHPSPEVRGRVRTTLDRLEIIPEDGKTAQLRGMFREFSGEEGPASKRQERLQAIFELDPRVAGFVAHELSEGVLDWVPVPAAVVAPGRLAFSFEVVNAGPCPAWIDPERWHVFADFSPFGSRPDRLTMHSGAIGAKIALRRAGDSPQKAMVRALAGMKRLLPEEKATIRTAAADQARCGILSMRAQSIGYSPSAFEAEFGATKVVLDEQKGPRGTTIVRVLLAETQGQSFRLDPWVDGADSGLDVTALRDFPGAKVANKDPFWWVALDDKGAFLDEGAFETTEEDLAALPKDGKRRLVRKGPLPQGTKTLWMGYSGPGEDCVPAPVEIR